MRTFKKDDSMQVVAYKGTKVPVEDAKSTGEVAVENKIHLQYRDIYQ